MTAWTPADEARNAAAVRNLAARLERNGWPGDAHAEAEHIALNLLADGYTTPRKPPPPTGPGASRDSIDAAIAAAALAVREARERRNKPAEPKEIP
jgi:hypothetical protein